MGRYYFILGERVRKIHQYRHTLWNMAISQLKTKYSASILGISWAVISPLLIMLAVTFVFTAIFKIEIKNFSFFVLSGMLPWMFFSNALSEVTNSILGQKNILHQFSLPREILPLSSVLSNFINFLLGWLIIYPLFLFLNPKIIYLLPLLAVVLMLNFFFVCGLGLILSVLNVFMRDISQLLNILLMLWFWLTPVFYSPDMVPVKFRWICNLNPMTPYIVYYREVVFIGRVPDIAVFISSLLLAVFSLFLGLLIFSDFESKLLKRI